MPVRSLDNPLAVAPLIFETERGLFGLFPEVERGNVEAAQLPKHITPIFYNPYFVLDREKHGFQCYSNLALCILELGSGSSIRIDPDLPISIAKQIRETVDAEIDAPVFTGSVSVHRASRAKISEALAGLRPSAVKAAKELLKNSGAGHEIGEWLGEIGTSSFERLDVLLRAHSAEAVVVSSPLNMQELGGVPVLSKQSPLCVVYRPGEDPWIIQPECSTAGSRFPDPAAALRAICGSQRIAVEEESLSIGSARSLSLDDQPTFAADTLLRQWRDESTTPDIPFYLIASQASLQATEAALKHAEQIINADLAGTELDAFAVYLSALRGFVSTVVPELRAVRTLTNFHSSSRTIFPSNPAAYPLGRSINTLKIDAGCLLFDRSGYMLGCSDVARTLCLTDEARELYPKFQRIVRDELIRACSTGRAGSEIHMKAIDALWPGKDEQKNALLVQPSSPSTFYSRDVGHLLGKNNLSHLTFTGAAAGKLRSGMIACCELQWPIYETAVAYEDTCIVSERAGLNITAI